MSSVEASGQGLFPADEVLAWAEDFLSQVGYQVRRKPDGPRNDLEFLATRSTRTACHKIAGVVRQNLDEAPQGLGRLREIAEVANDHDLDGVLIFPPVSEFFMIQFLTSERGKWYYDLKERQLMIWLCNPERRTTTCLVGAPRDELISQHFVSMGPLSFDQYIGMQLAAIAMDEEEDV